ncbi:hypothetical protein [Natronosalvus vescus]|uniref:hypothetical protein n=1 Tax=Natronosalvus vescus TaxID=2953881 RepID=UPI002090BF90|nr:hypothetical protein [Natronosalvus vescus]
MNTLIALGVTGVVWVLVTPLAGVVVFVGCLTAIVLRGYLVPGTPELTKRYLPDPSAVRHAVRRVDGCTRDK